MPTRIPKDAYVIIIGAMKCGTSSLYSYLQNHPQIIPAVIKEPEFFSENQGHGFKVDNYSDLWHFDGSIHKYALEASTGYTKYPQEPNVPKNIFKYGISPKFIYIIRNPFDRIISHFNFMKRKGSWKSNIDDKHLISTSNYSLQLDQYRKYFPLEDLLILDFDELRDNPSQLLQKIYNFLHLSYNYFPEEYKVKNRTLIESKFERKLRDLKFHPAFFSYVPKPLKQTGRNLLYRISSPDKDILTDVERKFVYDELKESMAILHDVYGFNVYKWGFDI